MKAIKASIMAMAAALLLLVAGALPVGGTPAVYKGGLMLALAVLLGLASLYATLRLAGREWWRLLLAMVMAFLLVGGVTAVWMYGAEGCRFASGGDWRWLGSLGLWCTAFLGAGMAVVGGLGVYRLMNRRLWLATVHLSLVAMGVGCMADFAGEVKGMVPMASAQNLAEPAMHKQLVDQGKAYPFGFGIGVRNFEVTYYEGNTYGLYAYEGRSWRRLASAEAEGGLIVFPEGIEVKEQEVRPLPGMPRPMYVLGGGKVVVKEEPPVKSYEARCIVDDGREQTGHTVRVNEPLFQGDWIFYLLSFRETRDGPLVQMMARRAPGRGWMLGGIVGLLVSTAFWCWKPDESREGAV